MVKCLNSSALSIGSSSVFALISILETYGFEQAAVAKISGIDLSCLDEQDSRLPLDQYQLLWKTALAITHKPALGLELGQVLNTSKIGLVGHVVLNSQTLAEGLEEYCRFFSIVNDAISLTMEVDQEYAYLRFIHLHPEYYCIPDMERTMTLFLYRAKAAFGKKIKWESADFQHAKPSYSNQYKKVFDCPLRFNQNYCQVMIKREYLKLEPAQFNPYIGNAAKQYANNLLRKLFRRSYADKVKTLIAQGVGSGEADVGHIAERLNTSRQTLYRKLKLEGVSFQCLLEEVRYSLAIEQLKESDLSLSEIAYSIGFSDLSAFSRAFKRWSGDTPKAYRESLNKSDSP